MNNMVDRCKTTVLRPKWRKKQNEEKSKAYNEWMQCDAKCKWPGPNGSNVRKCNGLRKRCSSVK